MRLLPLLVGVVLALGAADPALAHHVGVYTPSDTELTLNFKQIKAAAQSGRFDVALKLFDQGVLQDTMEQHRAKLPPGLAYGLRAALKAKELPGVELHLSIVLAFLTRERVREAATRLEPAGGAGEPRPVESSEILIGAWRYLNLVVAFLTREQGRDAPGKPEEAAAAEDQRRAETRQILIAAWRYYNLADFVIMQQNPRASVALRVAFEDAQSYLGGTAFDPSAAAGSVPREPQPATTSTGPPGAARVSPGPVAPDEGKARAAIAIMDRTLGEVIEEGAGVARKGGAKAFLPQQ